MFFRIYYGYIRLAIVGKKTDFPKVLVRKGRTFESLIK